MKQNMPLFVAVLLGAVATAIGMGAVLQMANSDRARLAREINQARETAAQALTEKDRIASEANEKVEAANAEVENAQHVLQILEEEQRLLENAKRLSQPPTREIRGWKPVVSLPLGVSLMTPPSASIAVNDAFGLRAVTNLGGASASTTWLSITPYTPEQETSLPLGSDASGQRVYVVDGHLLIGTVQTTESGASRAFFRVQRSASSTHLIELRDVGVPGGAAGFERVLGTLEFAD